MTFSKPHTFTIDVVSAEKDHTINSNWYVSGLLQVITDASSRPTKGGITLYDVEPYAATSDSGGSWNNGSDADILVNAWRNIHIESTVVSGSGEVTKVVWEQQLDFSNHQTYQDNAFDQVGVLKQSELRQ